MIKRAIPSNVRPTLRLARNTLRSLRYRGEGRYCPVCKTKSRCFGAYGVDSRADAQCMRCGAVERHRLTWLFFERRTNLLDGHPKDVLHVAPEPQFEKLLKPAIGPSYITADLFDPSAMVRMDVTNIEYPDNTFDVVYCSHVLEHVDDDLKAMSEFLRVLKPSGWAVLSVPISAAKTFEDPSVTDPAERLRLFGQEDHVRRYGPDYIDRLKSVGFKVTVINPEDFLEAAEISEMAVGPNRGEQIFFCTKS
ncbi:methyltransferase type 11 [Mycobacterium sp. EPG1]|nr:methyltransferase type 11 [Mycobacterium sp. EPG1]